MKGFYLSLEYDEFEWVYRKQLADRKVFCFVMVSEDLRIQGDDYRIVQLVFIEFRECKGTKVGILKCFLIGEDRVYFQVGVGVLVFCSECRVKVFYVVFFCFRLVLQ